MGVKMFDVKATHVKQKADDRFAAPRLERSKERVPVLIVILWLISPFMI